MARKTELRVWGRCSEFSLQNSTMPDGHPSLITVLHGGGVKKEVSIMSYVNIDEEAFNSACGRQSPGSATKRDG